MVSQKVALQQFSTSMGCILSITRTCLCLMVPMLVLLSRETKRTPTHFAGPLLGYNHVAESTWDPPNAWMCCKHDSSFEGFLVLVQSSFTMLRSFHVSNDTERRTCPPRKCGIFFISLKSQHELCSKPTAPARSIVDLSKLLKMRPTGND